MSSLIERLSASDDPQTEGMEIFLDWAEDQGITLYPAQEEAVLELFAGQHCLLKTPTGSGKSLVALALHVRAMSLGQKSVYTAPIKALVSEKFRALCVTFGAENVGLMTGDGSVNRDAPILCCTAEILSNISLQQWEQTPYAAVIMDEFHYYGDRDRGMAWQVPLLTMPHAQFLLLSATLGDTTAIEADLEERTSREVAVVDNAERPVPLSFLYSEEPTDSALSRLVSGGKAPVYAVHFSQREATELAQALTSSKFSSDEDKAKLKAAVKGFRFDSPFGQTLRRYVMHGVGLHHAGLLPKYRTLVETLGQQGLFKIICGTDTLGVGINLPIRSVLFTKLCKFDGQKVDLLSVRDFQQIAGRAGRKGFDTEGTVVVQAPDWIIENARLNELVAQGKKKKNKVVKKKPPTRGYKHWDKQTFDRMVAGRPETLEGRFSVDHGLLLQLIARCMESGGDALEELEKLVQLSHTGKRKTIELMLAGQERLTELIDAEVVVDLGEDNPPRYVLNKGVQEDFSLYHSLSLFLLHAIELLDKEDREYHLNLLSLVEAILPNPKVILYAQTNREKGIKVASLKAEGVDYEDRMAILEEVTYPKPRAEWTYEVYNLFAEHNPWLASEPIRPKGIVREIVEVQDTFGSWVKGLQLERSEGVVLRYLSEVYSTLNKNVPEHARTAEVDEVLGFLRAMIARIDDSLVKTWEAMLAEPDAAPEDLVIDISKDLRSFRARIRYELYAVVRALSQQDWEEAAACTRNDPESLSDSEIKSALRPYIDERGDVVFDGRLKQGWTTVFEELETHLWRVQQVLVDEHTDAEDDDHEAGEAWSIQGIVDLRGDPNPSGPIVSVREIGL